MPVSNGDSPYLFSPIWHILIFHPSMKASLNNFLRAGDTSTHSISHPSPYLIFVTDTRTVSVEKKSVMWRNFKFLYMKDEEKSKISPHVD